MFSLLTIVSFCESIDFSITNEKSLQSTRLIPQSMRFQEWRE